jgi:ATP-dependent Clp protease ATP-binding subunit ClpX
VVEAIKRKTGARGLRAILEDAMLDIMYDMPGDDNLKEVVMTEEAVVGIGEPIKVYLSDEERKERSQKVEAAVSQKK